MTTVISVENLSKTYRLGQIGTGTFTHDLAVWWAKVRGKPNPLLKIGEADHGNRDGEELWALKDVSFEVKQGEVLGIIGRNGAGKSTLLKILSRVTAPTSGKIKVKGRVASLLEVGTGFHPELTGRENIYLNGAILGMSHKEIERKFDEIVDFAEIEQFIDTPVKRYSSGMYVRLAFAVAAHLEPEILVVDEVLAVGDSEFQRKCLGKMGEVSQMGRTVLFVSHNLASISALCTKTLLLERGQVRCLNATSEVLSLYGQANIVNAVSIIDKPRSGNGVLRFTSLEIRNSFGQKLTAISSGQNIKIVLRYLSKDREKLKQVDIAFFVRTIIGELLFVSHSMVTDQVFYNIAPVGEFICDLPKAPLIPGLYNIDLWCRVDGQIADYVENADNLNVVSGDFYGTGKLPADKHKGMLVDYQWSYNEVTSSVDDMSIGL